MNIDQMDYNLGLDPLYYADEMIHRLYNDDFNREDLLEFLSKGLITSEQYKEYVAFLDWLEDNSNG